MQTFAVYVDNKPGVLNRVSSLFRRRAFNIESLTVGHTEIAGLSRMTIVVDTDERGARLVEANLYKLIAVRRVHNITRVPTIGRDLALIKVAARGEMRMHVMQLVDVYRARVVDVSPESLVIETTGTEDKIDSLLEVLPGVLLSVLLWITAAALFSRYLDLNDYSYFYGGLGQLMATMIFFWISAVIVLLGAELNRGLIELRKVQAVETEVESS